MYVGNQLDNIGQHERLDEGPPVKRRRVVSTPSFSEIRRVVSTSSFSEIPDELIREIIEFTGIARKKFSHSYVLCPLVGASRRYCRIGYWLFCQTHVMRGTSIKLQYLGEASLKYVPLKALTQNVDTVIVAGPKSHKSFLSQRNLFSKILGQLPSVKMMFSDCYKLDAFKKCVSFLNYCDGKKVRSLDLSLRPITDKGMGFIATKCPQLEELHIFVGREFSDRGLQELAEHCTGLQSLSICGECYFSHVGIDAIAGACPDLQKLVFDSLGDIDEEELEQIVHVLAKKCHHLKSLHFKGIVYFTNQFFREVGNCRGLEHLSIEQEENSYPLCVTNKTFQKMVEKLYRLKSLTIAIDDSELFSINRGVQMLAQHCHDLEELEIISISDEGITDDVIIIIANHCPRLKVLELGNNCGITDRSITMLAVKCPDLRILRFETYGEFTDKSIQALEANCFYLQKLEVRGALVNVTESPGLQSIRKRGCEVRIRN